MRAKAVLLVSAAMLAACGTTPRPADPPRLRAALEAESDGAKRYARGDFTVAERRFDEATRLFASIDDAQGSARNRLHLARTRLAQGHPAAALELLDAAAGAETELALDMLLLRAQAQLDLARPDAARQSLADADARCGKTCPQAASLHLLQARESLSTKRAGDALDHATSALKLLQGKDEAAETANAWRISAAARLAAGDTAGALAAARNALEIDRRLALPQKIARDWLLLGDIQRGLAVAEAEAAYRKALAVAQAARLDAITMIATQALQDIGMQKKP